MRSALERCSKSGFRPPDPHVSRGGSKGGKEGGGKEESKGEECGVEEACASTSFPAEQEEGGGGGGKAAVE